MRRGMRRGSRTRDFLAHRHRRVRSMPLYRTFAMRWLSGSGGGRPGTVVASRTPSAPPFSPKHQTQVSRARFRYAPDGHIGSRIGQEMSLHRDRQWMGAGCGGGFTPKKAPVSHAVLLSRSHLRCRWHAPPWIPKHETQVSVSPKTSVPLRAL